VSTHCRLSVQGKDFVISYVFLCSSPLKVNNAWGMVSILFLIASFRMAKLHFAGFYI
jgi:hypothetical protein